MALISVQRTPTILGSLQARVNNYLTGPGSAPYAWQVYRSGDFTSMGGGSTAGNLRFHTVQLSNNGPVAVRVVFDTSTSASATTADATFTTGFVLNVEETLTIDVSTLGGATGVRRVLMVNDIDTFAFVQFAEFVYAYVDVQVGFYTPHQSA
ncbi:MAG: hypothetical protein EBR99_08015 [Actinobacteria bacterium]|nr:hypothetical protein [Actinomycetota bacterium]